MKKLTTEEFKLKASKIHKNKYDYSEVIYKNNKEKIIKSSGYNLITKWGI